MSPLLALNDIVVRPMNVRAYKADEQQGLLASCENHRTAEDVENWKRDEAAELDISDHRCNDLAVRGLRR
jgi:hypothetical protein